MLSRCSFRFFGKLSLSCGPFFYDYFVIEISTCVIFKTSSFGCQGINCCLTSVWSGKPINFLVFEFSNHYCAIRHLEIIQLAFHSKMLLKSLILVGPFF